MFLVKQLLVEPSCFGAGVGGVEVVEAYLPQP